MSTNISRIAGCLAMTALFVQCYSYSDSAISAAGKNPDPNRLLKPAPGYQIVQRECTVCHSERLIIQNRTTREGWSEIIRWMQRTQNLREFSQQDEKAILDYLAENYAPQAMGRRSPLTIREWYVLEP